MSKTWWGTLSVPLFLWSACLSASAADLFLVKEVRHGQDTELWAENRDPYATRWGWLELEASNNVHSVPALPLGVALAPGEKRLVATINAQDPQRGFSYAFQTKSGEGDPKREPDRDAVYLLPYGHGSKQLVTQGYFGRMTHAGLQALDFDLKQGTPICAARAGTVIHVKQDSNLGGPDPSFDRFDNSIEVMHSDGTWAVYAHLQLNGARVREGQRVNAGEVLGLSGATGMASGPHLHFVVYQASWDLPRSVATVFKTGVSATASLQEGQTYYAYHPGGAPFTPVLGAELKDEDLRKRTHSVSGGKVRLREERVDQRNLVYCANGSDRPVDIVVSFGVQNGVRPSTGLPYRQRVPARTELYLFAVDFIGGQESSQYQLDMKVKWSN